MATTKKHLKKLARSVVAAQGNTFIKQLLRRRALKVGGSKSELLARIEKAIDDGVLVRDHFEEWLAEVEGWGQFHIYPFEVPASVQRRPRWQQGRVEERISGTSLEGVWEADSSFAFPKKLALTRASLTGRTLRLLWHQGVEWRRRASDKDRREAIGDDVYEFDAYHVRHERKVVRFVMDLDASLAAALVPYRLTDEQHKAALATVWESLEPLVAEDELQAFPLRRIIAAADRRQLRDEDGRLTTKVARLEAEDAWIEFGSSDTDGGYADVDVVREVRDAATGSGLRGGSATFLYGVSDERAPIHVMLSGFDRRIWVPAQIRESDVWSLLGLLKGFA